MAPSPIPDTNFATADRSPPPPPPASALERSGAKVRAPKPIENPTMPADDVVAVAPEMIEEEATGAYARNRYCAASNRTGCARWATARRTTVADHGATRNQLSRCPYRQNRRKSRAKRRHLQQRTKILQPFRLRKLSLRRPLRSIRTRCRSRPAAKHNTNCAWGSCPGN